MRKNIRNSWLVVLHILLGSLLLFGTYGFASAANSTDEPQPGSPENYTWSAPTLPQGPNGVLPATTCIDGAPRTCTLEAKDGTVTMPDGVSVDIWGYSSDTGPSNPPTLQAPTIIANQDESLRITLLNSVPGETMSLFVPGLEGAGAPDLSGIASGNIGLVYTFPFPTLTPGTYIYQAGLTPNGPKQVAMGLYGAMIVRPDGAPNQLYADPETTFDSEALLVFSEVDADLHADPVNFTLPNYRPEYWLVNGQAYGDIPNIQVAPGDVLALRLVNAGLQERSLGILGLDQTLVAIDGNPYPFATTVTAHTMGAGTSTDVLVQIPADAAEGTRYPVYNPGFAQMHNAGELATDGSVAYGGILTFIEVIGGALIGDTGPWASNVALSADIVAPNQDVTLSATLSELDTGGEDVVAAEYFIDTIGAPTTGEPITGFTPDVTVGVSIDILASTLQTLSPGDVIFYVRGQDADGTWGPVGSVVLDLVAEGPIIKGLSLTPSVVNGTKDVLLTGTADDRPTGQVNVVSAEYVLGVGGTPVALGMNLAPAPLTGLSGVIPAGDINVLAEGPHDVTVRAQDELLNWGTPGVIQLVVDKTGPGTLGGSVTPNPNNGTLPVHSSSYAVRVETIFNDALSNVVDAEGFIDTNQGISGNGFPFIAKDGLFDEGNEPAYVNIPLTTVAQLSEGVHTIYFHGLDQAGNWGDYTQLELIVDKTGPTTTISNISPNPTGGADVVTLTADAVDTSTNIVAAEWFEGFDPGQGQGTPIVVEAQDLNVALSASIDVSGWRKGDYVISVRSKDAAGNWGPADTVALSVGNNAMKHVLLDDFESGDLYDAWNYVTPNTYASFTTNMVGEFGMRAIVRDGKPAYVVDRTPKEEATYRAAFLFNPSDMKDATDPIDFFVGESDDGAQVFGLQFERSASGSEVRAWMLADGSRVYTEWVSVADAAQRLELMWKSDASGSLRLFVDNGLEQIVKGDSSAHQLDTVKLGPSAGLAQGMKGSMAFDEFESYRPIPGDDLPWQVFLPTVVSEVTQ